MKEKKYKLNLFNNNNQRVVLFEYEQLDGLYLGEVT